MHNIYFDKADRTLLSMVNAAMDSHDETESHRFDPHLHPHGIIEMATTHEFRMAHAAIRLLGSLEAGQLEDRLAALQTLHDEVMHSARTQFRYNTGRVLLQLMKDIVRTRSDANAQLKLMHDFRRAASGNPLVVRGFLERCRLLEMPEERNQLTLDYHVHDANTKGRKNPTHLIMDAWIKGIRYLSVIYYNFVQPEAARELLRAAEIMGISVRIGIEFSTPFRNRFVHFVWTPRGFSDTEAFLSFLDEKPTRALMQEGRKATAWVEGQVLKTLERWNSEHRIELAKQVGLDIPSVKVEDFRSYVSFGQASVLHLAEVIHATCLPVFRKRVAFLHEEYPTTDSSRRKAIDDEIALLDSILPEKIYQTWLTPEKNPELACLERVCDNAEMPEIMKLPTEVLLDWLVALRSGYRITLQLADLTPEDVLELLWDGQGLITHIELFNLKEWQENHLTNLHGINKVQRALNLGSILSLKRIVLGMSRRLKEAGDEERCQKFQTILTNISALQAPYNTIKLRSHIGTDSTSNSNFRHGMGLAVIDTLPPKTRSTLKHNHEYKPIYAPIRMELAETHTWYGTNSPSPFIEKVLCRVRSLPGFSHIGLQHRTGWEIRSTVVDTKTPNIITMGGGHDETSNNGFITNAETSKESKSPGFAYLNGTLLGWLKVLAGFIPAQWAFWYTDGWWFLVWFGALLWYLITLGRNIVQAVLSGGGLTPSMLTWREYVSWKRIADSLFYTGVSVLLLEVIIRRWLLEDFLGLTVHEHAVLVYSTIAICNGIYISAHNIIRGFPRQAIIANLFRSAFAIPLSCIFGEGLLHIFEYAGVADPMLFTQNCAAITSKCASDTVAAVIEGIADSNQNRRLRLWDYSTKLRQIFNNFTAISMLFPNKDMLKLMAHPAEYVEFMEKNSPEHLRLCAINSLDLMYFWMYQPYAQQTTTTLLCSLTTDERILLMRSQGVLTQVQLIGKLFIDGIIGANFAKALAFYLSQHERYLHSVKLVYEKSRKNYAHPFSIENKRQIEWLDRSLEERM